VYDRIEYAYSRQGEMLAKRDQNGTVHFLDYDKLGRNTQDRVMTLGSGVDGQVRRITRIYGVADRLLSITSYTQPLVRAGDVVNQVVMDYNAVGLLAAEYQSHAGPVDMATTPKVQYVYDDTTVAGELIKALRPTQLIYPNGRVVRYEYAESDSSSSSSGPVAPTDPDDCLNRIKFIADDNAGAVGTHLAEYTRLGLGSFVQVDYTEPEIRYDLAAGTGSDPYTGMDRFGRVVDLLWRNYGTAEDVVRIRHGYDRAGNRLYREDPVALAHGVDMDEAYRYDGLYQLETFTRGALNSALTAIAAPTFRQAWDFDSTGNWSRFREDKDADGRWDLDQTRQHNAANEITAIDAAIGNLWISPTHDRNGNMLRIPQPKDPTKQFTLKWDAWNRLVRVSDAESVITEYSHDGRNYRIVKRVYRDPSDPLSALSSPLSRYIYHTNDWRVIEDRSTTASPAPRPEFLTPTSQHVWGLRYIDDLILRDRNGDGDPDTGVYGLPASGLEERLYALQDPNWNAVAISGADGAVLERYRYAAYGNCGVLGAEFTDRSGTAWDWSSLYTGRELDGEAGLYYYRARYFDGDTGRFIGRDPIGYKGGINLYEYVGNSPVTGYDPAGHALVTSGCTSCPTIAAAALIATAAIAVAGPCHQWFIDHGWDGLGVGGGPDWGVSCHSRIRVMCALGFPAWTEPGDPIHVCLCACNDYNAVGWASLLIHELAHHYCPSFWGREDCAISAQNAC
jgi:RHS repeat-associated protein